jgi:hypothetical protein
MLIGRITGATRYLAPPDGWDTEKNGGCSSLAIADIQQGDNNVMVSAWKPTPAEIAALLRGESVYLYVWGTNHPPVYVGVAGAG